MQWDVEPDHLMRHMGRRRRPDEEPLPEQSDPERALEDPADGCPGGDQRCRFTLSLLRYYRRLDDNGNRVENPHLRHASELVVEALLFYESEEDDRRAYCRKLEVDKLRAENGS